MAKAKELGKFILILIAAYLAIVAILVPSKMLGGKELIMSLFKQMATLMPFGVDLGKVTLSLMKQTLEVPVNAHKYTQVLETISSPPVMQMVLQFVLMTFLFAFLSHVLLKLLHIEDGWGPLKMFERLVVELIAALASIVGATYLMSLLSAKVFTLDLIWIVLIYVLVSGGGLVAMILLLSFSSLLFAVLFYLLHYVIINGMKLALTAAVFMGILICIYEGVALPVFSIYGVLLAGLAIMMICDLIINKIFGD